jgi:hypothetical protein
MAGAQQLTGIIERPPMGEDYMPGSVRGTSAIRLFVRFAVISPPPRHGDKMSITAIVYDVVDGSTWMCTRKYSPSQGSPVCPALRPS